MSPTRAQRDSRGGLLRGLWATAALTLLLVGGAARCSTDDSAGSNVGNGQGDGDRDTPAPDAPDDRGALPDLSVPTDFLPVFPGAQGFGTDTIGGRGGRVYAVTTLDWEGRGSLSEALTATEPRIIVFRVSGVIDVGEGVSLTEDHSYVTVAGQTSPGGITLTGAPGAFIEAYQSNFHDAVFRFLRFRGRGNYDNVSFNHSHHLVFDHCDFSGATDETFDVTYGHDVTVQWSTINNSDASGQNYGALVAYNPTANITFHHNLFAHHANRCGTHMHWAGGVPEPGATIDFTNNVVYNCAFDAIMYHEDPEGGGSRVSFNLIGNYFKGGPSTPDSAYAYRLPGGAQFYEDGTVYEGGTVWSGGNQREGLAAPVPAPPVATQSTEEAYEIVLDWVGALPRDAMNARTVDDVRNGTGRLGKLDDDLLTGGPEPPADTDLDGMPDTWENAHGLDPDDAGDASADRDDDGYTNVEEYLNELADSLLSL